MAFSGQKGFSYIDVMIAIVILMVGVLAMMAGVSAAVIQSKGQEQQMVARQVASSTLESIMSVKETDPARLGWDAVGNIGSNVVNGVPRGIFVVGFQPVFADAGPDLIIGTADDTGMQMQAMRRRIQIIDECDPERPSYNCPTPGLSKVRIRTVIVTVSYFVGNLERQETVRTVMTDYAVVEEV
jgi:type II secretory pathway pseudopilin PulG